MSPSSFAFGLWWCVLSFLAGAAAVQAAALAAGLRALPTAGWHWTERSRRAWSVRSSARTVTFVAPILTGALTAAVTLDERESLQPVLIGCAAYACVWGALLSLTGILRDADVGRRGYTYFGRADMVSPLVTAFGSALWVALGVAATTGHRMVAVVLLAAALGFAHWRRHGGSAALGTTDAPAELVDRVDRAAARSGVDVRRVYVVDTASSNAWVDPDSGKVWVTRALLEFPDAEIDAVLDHELGHLATWTKERAARWRNPLFATSVVGTLLWFEHVWIAPVLVAGAVVTVAEIRARRRSRSMERDADHHAACSGGDDGTHAALASALQRIARQDDVPVVVGGDSTHPDTYDRMLELGVTPAYARPAPPSVWRTRLGLWTGLATGVALLAAARAVMAEM